MSLSVNKLHPLFGVEITGADVRNPDREFINTIEDAMAEYAVVVLRDQFISDEEQLAFSRKFGPLELPPHMGMKQDTNRGKRVAPELYEVTNLDANGDFLPTDDLRRIYHKANSKFHTDSSFNALPTKWSLLSARIVPPAGADTLFVDTRAVYDALPEEMKEKVNGAIAEHYFWNTRIQAGMGDINEDMQRAMPPVQHNVVREIPESGRTALYIGNHATHIINRPVEEGKKILQELNVFATQEEFVYTHKWREGDLVIWDNRCTLHRATQYDAFKYKRDLRRATINEYGPEISSTGALAIPAPA